MESRCELRTHHHPHIIAVGTLLSSLWSILDSPDTREEMIYIIRSLDIGDILDLADLHECIISLIVL